MSKILSLEDVKRRAKRAARWFLIAAVSLAPAVPSGIVSIASAEVGPRDGRMIRKIAAQPSRQPRRTNGSANPDLSLRRLLRRHRIEPVRGTDFADSRPEVIELGRLLFYDKELSGNRDISCATCHHALMATADGLSLPAGVGGAGLSTARSMGPGRARVPRNSPDIFNRGHASFTTMFWDGRVERDAAEPSGFRSPAGDDLPLGFASALEVQAMFPVTSEDEMLGRPGENELADAESLPEIWRLLMDRLLSIEEYRDRFAEAFPDVPERGLGFEHAARAIAAFEAAQWRSDRSPFDQFLRGDDTVLDAREKRGAVLFYGRAGCVECHSGPFQTDLEFHAIALPQIGPGKEHGPDGDEDHGRSAITGDPEDRFRFRTPSLRNVALTAPYGHAGTHRTLESIVRHHLAPIASLRTWDASQVLLPVTSDPETPFSVMNDPTKRTAIAYANELRSAKIGRRDIDDLIAFLGALTDSRSLDLRAEVPLSVPSGLSLAD